MSAEELAQLYSELAPAIRRLCTSYLKCPDDAEDMTQETFARLAACLDRLQGDPAAYAFRIARNLSCNELSRRRRHDKAATRIGGGTPDIALSALARSECRDLLGRVQQAVSAEDMALFMHLAEGQSQAEVADLMGLTEKTVSVRLCRARKRVRALFGAASAVASLGVWARLRQAARPGGGRAPALVAPGAMLSVAFVGMVTFGTLTAQLWGGRNMPAPAVGGTAARVAIAAPASGEGPTPAPQSLGTPPLHRSVPGLTAQPVTPVGLAHSLLNPGDGAKPEDTGFTSIAVSPGYRQDHTVLASGVVATGCSNPLLCNVLFKSVDGGATWQHLAGQGFAGGTLLLPPAYTRSHTMFAVGPAGLQQSADGGETFQLLVPGVATAAVSPDSTAADTRLLLGTAPLTVYDSATRTISRGPILPSATSTPYSVAYGGSKGTVFVTAQATDVAAYTTGSGTGELIRCDAAACRVVANEAGSPDLQLAVSPAFDRDGTIDASAGPLLIASHDAGRTFTTTVAPHGFTWHATAPTGSAIGDVTMVAVSQAPAGNTGVALSVSRDDGVTFSTAQAAGLPADVLFTVIASMPDGRLLAGLQPAGGAHVFGLRCSADGGLDWATAC